MLMPSAKELMQRMRNARSGYWKKPVTTEDVPKTFITCEGHYEFVKMPFGMINAGATMVKYVKRLPEGMKDVDNYMDDIVVFSVTWEGQLELLGEPFRRMDEAQITERSITMRVGQVKYKVHLSVLMTSKVYIKSLYLILL